MDYSLYYRSLYTRKWSISESFKIENKQNLNSSIEHTEICSNRTLKLLELLLYYDFLKAMIHWIVLDY